ncbi:MLO-like protein 7 isoform X1 [Curcuma longa]|uniref:MLO-like protein 7 isoform X1 n=1 Tax=Curcuma longa TaxID=136217 RepID=UPI003D9ED76F
MVDLPFLALEPISKRMEGQGLEFLQFAFRWFNCLLIREIPFHLVTHYLAEGDSLPNFLVYISTSLLLTVGTHIFGYHSFLLLVIIQFPCSCSYNTLPLYVIVTQMGSYFKKAIFYEHVQEGLLGWAHKVKKRKAGKTGNGLTKTNKSEDESSRLVEMQSQDGQRSEGAHFVDCW